MRLRLALFCIACLALSRAARRVWFLVVGRAPGVPRLGRLLRADGQQPATAVAGLGDRGAAHGDPGGVPVRLVLRHRTADRPGRRALLPVDGGLGQGGGSLPQRAGWGLVWRWRGVLGCAGIFTTSSIPTRSRLTRSTCGRTCLAACGSVARCWPTSWSAISQLRWWICIGPGGWPGPVFGRACGGCWLGLVLGLVGVLWPWPKDSGETVDVVAIEPRLEAHSARGFDTILDYQAWLRGPDGTADPAGPQVPG